MNSVNIFTPPMDVQKGLLKRIPEWFFCMATAHQQICAGLLVGDLSMTSYRRRQPRWPRQWQKAQGPGNVKGHIPLLIAWDGMDLLVHRKKLGPPAQKLSWNPSNEPGHT